MKAVFTVENIDCPNCAAKIERAIAALDEIESASLSYAQGLLHVTASDTDGLLEKIQAASDAVEEGVVFTERRKIHPHTHVQHHGHEVTCRMCENVHEQQEARPAAHPEHVHKFTAEHATLLIGGVIFLAGLGLHITKFQPELLSNLLLLAAYLVLGLQVLVSAGKNMRKGQIFDENFLMTIATAGALCIGCWEEAAGVMLFYRIGELFEHMAVERSRKSVMDAIDMRPETVQLCTADGGTESIPAEYVQPGDRILVRAGDRIPVDGIVLRGESSLDTAAMTGESVPVSIREGDAVMSGCINLSGVIELRAEASLAHSMVQRVLDSVENAAAGKPKLDRFITRFARIYTPIVVGAALLTAILPSLITGNWSYWIYAALNFLMISCPCALVLSVPLAFFSGIGAGSVKGVLFKDGLSLEALDTVKAVVMDKTGTLTEGSFTITAAESQNEMENLIRYAAALEQTSTHPVAKSILAYANAHHIDFPTAQNVQEIAGKGIIGELDGHHIACGNTKLMEQYAITPPDPPHAGTCVYVTVDGRYFGYLVLSDTIKPRAAEAVAAMHACGLYTVMLTGDSEAHTRDVARTLGIDEMHAGLLPDEKPRRMEAVRKAKGAVLFVGDGINDAPVISGADVGAAMGTGADAAMEAADIVLLGSDPRAILTAFDIADRVGKTARFCIIFALAVKIAVMLAALLGFANMWVSVFADTGVTILCVLIVLWRVHFYYRRKPGRGVPGEMKTVV